MGTKNLCQYCRLVIVGLKCRNPGCQLKSWMDSKQTEQKEVVTTVGVTISETITERR